MKAFEETIKFFKESKQLYYFDEQSCVFYKVTDVWSVLGASATVCLDNNTRVLVWIKHLMTLKDMKNFIHSERFKNIQSLHVKRLTEELKRLMEINDDTI